MEAKKQPVSIPPLLHQACKDLTAEQYGFVIRFYELAHKNWVTFEQIASAMNEDFSLLNQLVEDKIMIYNSDNENSGGRFEYFCLNPYLVDENAQ